MNIDLTINGLTVNAHFRDDEIEQLHKPLLKRLATLNAASSHERTVVFLCAPPGTGKSTLTTFWEYLAAQDPELPTLQTLPMDGFHHYNIWLDAHHLRQAKGAPETFDVAKLARTLRQIRAGDGEWPQYDRNKHDPVENAITVTAPIVVIEGNWLLLDDERWADLMTFCDFSLFINAPEQALRARLIARKRAGGLSQTEAEAFYAQTDSPNVRRVLTQSRAADLTLAMSLTGEYSLGQDE